MYFGVLYHLRNPLLSLQKIASVASGTLLLQTLGFERASLGEMSVAQFHPFGIVSGPPGNPIHDTTVFWIPNSACIRDMLLHVGFIEVEPVPQPSSSSPTSNGQLTSISKLKVAANRLRPRSSKQAVPATQRLKGLTSPVFRAKAPVPSPGQPPDVTGAESDGAFTGASRF